MAKPAPAADVSITSTLPGEKIAMGIDAGAIQHIMSVLTDLYSDPEKAVLREYSTNARDAHIAAKNSAAIEVDLPTPLAPFLTIRDFGVGLSAQDIANIYSRYGASTKRGNNDETGMLGLGCKSALTYASQFTLVGCKGGRRVQVAISRDADGTASMTIVSDEPTDDPNGVEVVIPAKPDNDFESKARELFSYWPEGSVLLNGKAPERFEGLDLGDGLFVREGNPQNLVVMGGVPYPVENLATCLQYSSGFVAYVPIGDVHFTPSREALQDTAATQATLKSVAHNLKAGLTRAIQKEIDGCDSRGLALRTMLKWQRVAGGLDDFKYRGETMPQEIVGVKSRLPRPDGTFGTVNFTVTDRTSYTLSRASDMRAIGISTLERALWIKGYGLSKFTANHKRKLQQFCDDKGWDTEEIRQFILTEEMPPQKQWIDSNRVVEWDDVNAIKLPVGSNVGSGYNTRPKGSYHAHVDGAEYPDTIQAADIDTKHPIYYHRGGQYSGTSYIDFMKAHHKKFTLVVMGLNRVEKFKRDFPQAKEVNEAIQGMYDAWVKTLSKDDREGLAMHGDYYSRRDFQGIDPNKVDDPGIKRAARIVKRNVDKLVKLNADYRRHGIDTLSDTWDNPLDKYPLWDRHIFGDKKQREHVYLYLNTIYSHLTNQA